MIWETDSQSLEDTLALGAAVGRQLKGGEVIELVSDLGGGKTAFVRGLAECLESSDSVASPSFTISRVYRSGHSLELHHFDFYRLGEPGVIRDQLQESITDPNVATAIEWSAIVTDVLPDDRLTIEIEATGEDDRHLKFTAGPKHQHLLKELA